jgi:hypothetical protein
MANEAVPRFVGRVARHHVGKQRETLHAAQTEQNLLEIVALVLAIPVIVPQGRVVAARLFIRPLHRQAGRIHMRLIEDNVTAKIKLTRNTK